MPDHTPGARQPANAMRSHFLTERAAVRQMRRQGGGVLLAFGGGGTQTQPGLGGFKVALDAVEGLRRQWSLEHGEDGIRFVTLKTGGIPETIPEGTPGREEIVASLRDPVLLDRLATFDDVGKGRGVRGFRSRAHDDERDGQYLVRCAR